MHMQGLHLIHVLVSLGTGGTEVKNAWMSAMGLVLLRASLQGSEVSSRSMTWMSVCFPKLSMVSIGLRVFAFFVAGPSESSLMLTISGKVDVDGVLTRVAGFPVLRAGRLGETVLSCGKGEDKLEGIDVAVVALVGPPLL